MGDYGVYFRPLDERFSIDTPIFRYMKLEYLFQMLNQRNLFIANRRSFSDVCDRECCRKFIPTPALPYNIEEVPSYRTRKYNREQKETIEQTKNLCISCWTLDNDQNENSLMWRAFKNGDLMCRIQTTPNRIIQNVECEYNLLISDVYYGNRGCPTMERFTFNKTPFYSDEREVRMVLAYETKENISIHLNNIFEVIEGITLSPFLTPQIESMVESDLKRRYRKLSEKIHRSEIMEY